jgi:Mrp family chromosome partitioning ATPase
MERYLHLDLLAAVPRYDESSSHLVTEAYQNLRTALLFARKDVTDFLDRLRQQFEWVLLDSPPLASVTDALLLARHADISLFVVQHNKVDKRLIKRNVAALRKVAPNLLGAVLNGVDVKNKGYYYYYYHQEQANEPGAPRKPGPAPRKAGPRPLTAAKP